MTTTAQAPLLPCPHCGQAPTVHECDWSEPPTWSVLCGCVGCTHATEAEAIAAWNTRSPSPAGEASEPHPVFAYLLGAGPLDGVWFGDKHPTEKGAFWWRKHLRAALAAAKGK